MGNRDGTRSVSSGMRRGGAAFVAALALHALVWSALRRMHPPATTTATGRRPIELTLLGPRRAPPPPPENVESQPAPASTTATAQRARPPETHQRTASATRQPERDAAARAAPPDTSAADEAGASAVEPRAPNGTLDLFPHAILDRAAHAPPAAAASAAAPSDEPASVGARVDGWLRDDAADRDTRQGKVASAWRDVERGLASTFKPPTSVVHDEPTGRAARLFDRLHTFLQQDYALVRRGDEAVRRPVVPGATITEQPMGHSIDPSVQTFFGVPEGNNLRTLPLEQQTAVTAATGDPVAWLRVEIEVTVDADGAIVDARVASPSGRRRFDRYALAAVRERVAGIRAGAAVSRWAVEAAYAVAPPTSLGVTFDLDMIFDKAARKQAKVRLPLDAEVRTRVGLLWVRARSSRE